MTLEGPLTTVTFTIYFSNQSANTGSLTYTGSTPGNITFSYSNASSVSMFKIISKIDAQIYFDVSNFTYNPTTSRVVFTQHLYAGGYKLWVHLNGSNMIYKGWY